MADSIAAPASPDPALQAWYHEGAQQGFIHKDPQVASWIAEGVKSGYLRDESGASAYTAPPSAAPLPGANPDLSSPVGMVHPQGSLLTPNLAAIHPGVDVSGNAQRVTPSLSDMTAPSAPPRALVAPRAARLVAPSLAPLAAPSLYTTPSAVVGTLAAPNLLPSPKPSLGDRVAAAISKYGVPVSPSAKAAKAAGDAMIRQILANRGARPVTTDFNGDNFSAPNPARIVQAAGESVRNFVQGATAPGIARFNAEDDARTAQGGMPDASPLHILAHILDPHYLGSNIQSGLSATLAPLGEHGVSGADMIGKQVPSLAPNTTRGAVYNALTAAGSDPGNILLTPTGLDVSGAVRELAGGGTLGERLARAGETASANIGPSLADRAVATGHAVFQKGASLADRAVATGRDVFQKGASLADRAVATGRDVFQKGAQGARYAGQDIANEVQATAAAARGKTVIRDEQGRALGVLDEPYQPPAPGAARGNLIEPMGPDTHRPLGFADTSAPPAPFAVATDPANADLFGGETPSAARITQAAQEHAIHSPSTPPLSGPILDAGETGATPPKPLYMMSADELHDGVRASREADKGITNRVFGPDAPEYRQQSALANSLYADHSTTRAASARVEEMENALSPAQQHLLFNGDSSHHEPDDFRPFIGATSYIEDAQDAQDLGSRLGRALLEVGDATNPETMTHSQQLGYAQLRLGNEVIQRNGFDPKAVSAAAAQRASQMLGGDADDIKLMLGRFLGRDSTPSSATNSYPTAPAVPGTMTAGVQTNGETAPGIVGDSALRGASSGELSGAGTSTPAQAKGNTAGLPSVPGATFGGQSVDALANAHAGPASAEVGGLPQTRLAPEDVKVMPGIQYKRGIDSSGVTPILKTQKDYQTEHGGMLTVYKDADGQHWAVDGHHRVELANRAASFSSPAADGSRIPAPRALSAQVLDHSAGWTPQTAKIIGILKNLRENKGVAIDAADALRGVMSEDDAYKHVGNLPPGALSRDTQGLVRSGEEIRSAVRNKTISEAAGAAIGSTVPGDPTRQQIALGEIQKNNISNYDIAARTAQVVRDEPITLRDQSQGDLFGDDPDHEALKYQSTAGKQATIEAAVRNMMAKNKSDLLNATNTELRPGESIDVAGRKADAAVLSDTKSKADLLFNFDPDVKSAIRQAAADVLNGHITDAEATHHIYETVLARGSLLSKEPVHSTPKEDLVHENAHPAAAREVAPAPVDQPVARGVGSSKPGTRRNDPGLAERPAAANGTADPGPGNAVANGGDGTATSAVPATGAGASVPRGSGTVPAKAAGAVPQEGSVTKPIGLQEPTRAPSSPATAAPAPVKQSIALTRKGDFYEAYGEDAETLAKELQINLSRKGPNDNTPMAGVPYNALDRYVAALSDKGIHVVTSEGALRPTKSAPSPAPTQAPAPANKPALQLHLTDSEAFVLSSNVAKPLSDRFDALEDVGPDGRMTIDLSPTERAEVERAMSNRKMDKSDPDVKGIRKQIDAAPMMDPAPGPRALGMSFGLGGPSGGGSGGNFITDDVAPLVGRVKTAGQQIRAAINPAGTTPEAGQAARTIRVRNAERARNGAMVEEQVAKAQTAFRRVSVPERMDFIHRMETGQPQATPELQEHADALSTVLRDRETRLANLGHGAITDFIKDYFPHIWEDPVKAQAIIDRMAAARPMEGSKDFTRARSIPTIQDGLNAGLKPVTTNPADLIRLKATEVDRYIMSHEIFNDLKIDGKLIHALGPIPDGYAPVNDKMFKVAEFRPTKKADGTPGSPERIDRGQFVAPTAVAQVLNNYLSKGYTGEFHNIARQAANTINSTTLGLSAYHGTVESINAMASDLAMAFMEGERAIRTGRPDLAARAGLRVLRSAVPGASAVRDFVVGGKLMKEYAAPGSSADPEVSRLVNAIVQGGGRGKMEANYSVRNVKTGTSPFSELTDKAMQGNLVGAASKLPRAVVEAAAKPLMEHYVPRLKMAALADMARYELDRLGPNATQDQVREAMARASDSIDNRYGQLVYDNLFVDKAYKDLSMLSVRAPGWNIGTVRELGGSKLDAATALPRMVKGGNLFTHRMAYGVALPVTVGLLGAYYQYLRTGERPKDLADYFAPRTGETKPDGKPERVVFPSYMKDEYALLRAGQNEGASGVLDKLGDMATHKQNPLLGLTHDLLTNTDFFNNQIADPQSPLLDRMIAKGKFAAGAAAPFAAKNLMDRAQAGTPAGKIAESIAGIQPASADIDRSKAELLMYKYMKGNMPAGAKSPDQAADSGAKNDLRARLIAAEKLPSQEAKNAAVRAAEDAATKAGLSDKQADSVVNEEPDPRLRMFMRLSAEQALSVYEAGTPAEKAVFKLPLQDKLDNYQNAKGTGTPVWQRAIDAKLVPPRPAPQA